MGYIHQAVDEVAEFMEEEGMAGTRVSLDRIFDGYYMKEYPAIRAWGAREFPFRLVIAKARADGNTTVDGFSARPQ